MRPRTAGCSAWYFGKSDLFFLKMIRWLLPWLKWELWELGQMSIIKQVSNEIHVATRNHANLISNCCHSRKENPVGMGKWGVSMMVVVQIGAFRRNDQSANCGRWREKSNQVVNFIANQKWRNTWDVPISSNHHSFHCPSCSAFSLFPSVCDDLAHVPNRSGQRTPVACTLREPGLLGQARNK